MKNKILLSTLLGGALMAGCTADDVLEVNKDVAGKVNPAAPVFTVSFGDDNLTRATMGNSITWQDMDKMSLYHGGGSMSGNTLTPTTNFFANGIYAYTRNAVYGSETATTSGDTPGAMEFKTSAMVLPGAAIMVFPADTKLENRDSENPIISVNLVDQDKNTRNLTPYVSEVLKIDDAGDNNGLNEDGKPLDQNSAGYGRKYDIAMRRIGGELRLNLDEKNKTEVLKNIEYRKITMSVEGDVESYPFTDKMEIKFGKNRNYSTTGGKTYTELGGDNSAHQHWAYTPWIEPTSDGKKNAVSTKYIPADADGKYTAYFSLLPPDDRDNQVFTAEEGGEQLEITNPDNKTTFSFRKPLFEKVNIKINTNYGKIVYESNNTDAKGAKIWQAGGSTDGTIPAWDLTMYEGLGEFLYSNFRPRKTGNKDRNGREIAAVSEYEGQMIALWGARTLTINLKDLDMNGLHITDEDNLNEVLDVYNSVVRNNQEKNKITLILDGKQGGDYPGKFKMTKNTWERLETLFKETQNVTLALCDETGEACSAIVLDNKGATSAANVPALQFITSVTLPLTDKVKATVPVELVGDWNYVSSSETTKYLNLKGISELIVKKDATLYPKGYITATGDFTITVEKDGYVKVQKVDGNVNDAVLINRTINNHGEITIDEGCFLRAGSEGKVVNCEVPVAAGVTGLTEEGSGKIHNYGTLGVVQSTTGETHNYGIIEILSNTASTLVSKSYVNNGGLLRNSFATNNKAGTIILNNPTGNGLTDVKDNGGFKKLKINKSNPTSEEIGIANYLILDEGCDRVGDLSNVPYVEIQSTNVQFTEKIKLSALVVPQNKTVQILNTGGIDITNTGTVYLKGHLTNAGTFTWNSVAIQPNGSNTDVFTGYFGGLKTDSQNMTVQ